MKIVNQLLSGEERPVLLNIGSGNRFLGGSSLARNDVRLVNLDVALLASVNVVGDAQQLPFADEVFDGIICQAVLEHVPRPHKVVGEMVRVLVEVESYMSKSLFSRVITPHPGISFVSP